MDNEDKPILYMNVETFMRLVAQTGKSNCLSISGVESTTYQGCEIRIKSYLYFGEIEV